MQARSRGHARDADMVLGDNGQIVRLVGTNGTVQSPTAYLQFTYDDYDQNHRVIPRAAVLVARDNEPDFETTQLRQVPVFS